MPENTKPDRAYLRGMARSEAQQLIELAKIRLGGAGEQMARTYLDHAIAELRLLEEEESAVSARPAT
jgi:hypothetical protein